MSGCFAWARWGRCFLLSQHNRACMTKFRPTKEKKVMGEKLFELCKQCIKDGNGCSAV